MIGSAFRAFAALGAPELRGVVLKSLLLTVVLFAAVLFGLYLLLSWVTILPWAWLETVIELIAGAGVLLALLFLMGPVTAMFAGLFLDGVADSIETRDYPDDRQGVPLSGLASVAVGLKFMLAVLAANLAVLPFFLVGIGAVGWLVANSYLIGREYFGMIAARYMPPAEAEAFRKTNALRVTAAGVIPALLSIVPLANIVTPVFSTAYFVYLVKGMLKDR
jgi:CysZ protein